MRLYFDSLRLHSSKEKPPHTPHTHTTHSPTPHIPVPTTTPNTDHGSHKITTGTPEAVLEYYEWNGRDDTH